MDKLNNTWGLSDMESIGFQYGKTEVCTWSHIFNIIVQLLAVVYPASDTKSILLCLENTTYINTIWTFVANDFSQSAKTWGEQLDFTFIVPRAQSVSAVPRI